MDCTALAAQLADLHSLKTLLAVVCLFGGLAAGSMLTGIWYERRYRWALERERQREDILGPRMELSYGNGYPTEEVERELQQEGVGREPVGSSLPRRGAGAGVSDDA